MCHVVTQRFSFHIRVVFSLFPFSLIPLRNMGLASVESVSDFDECPECREKMNLAGERTCDCPEEEMPQDMLDGAKNGQPCRRPIPLPKLIIMTTITGLLFGAALEKGGVARPAAVVGQMIFTDLTMLKLFLYATGSTMIVFSILSHWEHFERAHFFHRENPRGFHVVFGGSFVGGLGMTIAGGCAGTLASQLGSWVPNSWIAVLGALLGGLAYGLMEPMIKPHLQKYVFKKKDIHHLFQKEEEHPLNPFRTLAPILGSCMVVGVFLVEYFLQGITLDTHAAWFFAAKYWPVVVSGMLIGLSQVLPVRVLHLRGLGTSYGYVSGISILINLLPIKKPFKNFQYLEKSITCNFQVVLLIAMALGALASSLVSGTFGAALGVGPARAFIGGFLILLGARLANGCTSGHGITGMSHFAFVSFLAVAGMFAGGISLAMVWEYTVGGVMPSVALGS